MSEKDETAKVPCEKAMKFYEETRNYVLDKCPFIKPENFFLDDGITAKRASCLYGNKENPYDFMVAVGCKGIKGSSYELDDYDFVYPIINMFHEGYGHGSQIYLDSQRTDAKSKAIAMNYMACKASKFYYYGIGEKNYYGQPFEISAEYEGLKEARRYLSDKLGKDRCNELLLEYVNKRVHSHEERNDEWTYFLRKDKGSNYGTVDEAFADFEETLDKAIHTPRPAMHDYTVLSDEEMSDDDKRIAKLFHIEDEVDVNYLKENTNMKQKFLIRACNNGMVKDLMIASIYLDSAPEGVQYKKSMPALKDASSVEKVFKFASKPKWLKKDVDVSSLYSNWDKDIERSADGLGL